MILSFLFPLILLSAIGYVLFRTQLIRSDWSKGTADLTTQLLIPCLLFLGMYENGLPKDASLLAVLRV